MALVKYFPGTVKLYRQHGEHFCKRYQSTTAAAATPKHEETKWSDAKPFDEMPGPKRIPVLGSMWMFLPVIGEPLDVSKVLELNQKDHEKYGPIWRTKMPGFPDIVTTVRAEDAQAIFRNETKLPQRPGFSVLQKYRQDRPQYFTSMGILGNGESWWNTRSIAQPTLLKPKNVMDYIPALGEISDDFIARIRLIRPENNEMAANFVTEMYRWALESVGVVAFNTRLGCLEPNLAADSEAMKMIAATNLSFSSFNELEFQLPFWKYFDTPLLRQVYEAQDFLTETAMKYTKKTLDAIKDRPEDSVDQMNILEQVLSRGLSYKETVAMVTDFLMAGIDTTSHVMAFLLYFLTRNPEKQEILRQEVLSAVGPRGSPATLQALNKMPYLKACIKESLRLTPATVGNARISEEDLVLSGYQVPSGSLVVSFHKITGVSEEQFAKPHDFIPERWIKGHPLESTHHPYAILPFGFGKRMCIGRRLAELEMWQLTIKILQNFKVEYHHEDIGCTVRLVIVPDKPLHFQFIDLP